MPVLLWDASALVQKYTPEPGSDTAEALFDATPPSDMSITVLGYAETFATLVRKRNRRDIEEAAFAQAATALQDEIIDDVDFVVLHIEYDDIIDSVTLIQTHNINSADAAILTTYLRYAASVADICVLVASDRRLLRAAADEGLTTLDPETLPAADVPAFLASLT